MAHVRISVVLDLVFSSKRADVDDATLEEQRKPEEPKTFEVSGGLSVTCCLSDFSMHMCSILTGEEGGAGDERRNELQNFLLLGSLRIGWKWI